MRICDRCKREGHGTIAAYYGCSRWDNDWTEICGEEKNVKYKELCRDCRKQVAQKVLAAMQQDQAPPAYVIPQPRTHWLVILMLSLMAAGLALMFYLNWNRH